MNNTHGILIGGLDEPKKTLIVNLNNFQMTEGPTLINPRASHSCGTLHHANGTKYVVVSSGFYTHNSTELLRMDSNEGWFKGKESVTIFICIYYSVPQIDFYKITENLRKEEQLYNVLNVSFQNWVWTQTSLTV